jgi:hypothetical protein
MKFIIITEKLQIKSKEDWYNVNPEEFFTLAGESSNYFKAKYSGLVSITDHFTSLQKNTHNNKITLIITQSHS